MMVTIAGPDRTSKVKRGSLSITYSANHRAVAEFTLIDRTTGSPYRPSLNDTVGISHGSDSMFSGIVTGMHNEPFAKNRGARVRVTCNDYSAYATWRVVRNYHAAAGSSLKTILQGLVTTYLSASPMSVTNWSSMANGSTQPALDFDGRRLDEVFTELCDAEGWVWEILDTKEFRAYAIGSRGSAPGNFTTSDAYTQSVAWTQNREVGGYANVVYVRYKDNAEVQKPDVLPSGPQEVIVAAPDVEDPTQAAAIANTRLSRLSATPKEITIQTALAGYRPGMSATVDFPNHGLSNVTVYIREVRTTDAPRRLSTSTRLFNHTVDCVTTTALPSDWRDFYSKTMSNPGGTIAGAMGGITGGGPIYVHLGGSRELNWRSINYLDVPDAVYVSLDSADFASRTPVVQAYVKASAAGTQVRLEFWKISDGGAQIAESGWTASGTTWTAVTITGITLTTGVKTYCLRVKGDNLTNGVYAIGYLEA